MNGTSSTRRPPPRQRSRIRNAILRALANAPAGEALRVALAPDLALALYCGAMPRPGTLFVGYEMEIDEDLEPMGWEVRAAAPLPRPHLTGRRPTSGAGPARTY